MNLVTGAVGSLLPKLLKLLGNEYNLQRGLKKKVKYLELELRSIDALLKKVSHVPSDELDEQIMVWARDIREASYDMEDILDTFLVHIEGPKPNDLSRLQRAVNKIKNLFCKIKVRHDIGSAIQDIMKHLQEVADRRARYKIDDLVVNSTAINTSTSDPRLKAMYKEVTSFVGIDEPCKDLLSKLSKGQGGYMSRQKKIVSIFGTGGIGKTTIAKVVYDMLIADFECQAFVPVGQNPNLVKLLMDILYELDKSKYADIHTKKIDKRQLIDSLREFLQNKRYIIVIDDIWETKPWTEAMDQALLENNFGSRIIITTRNAKVATQIGHEVVPLSSFKLLRVLDMEACKNVSRSHLIHLEKLLHLRYLGLERALIDDLPTEIGALKLLQILNLDRTRIRRLTESISQLTQLVCLKGDRMKTLAPNWIGELTSLEELQVAIDFSNDGEEDNTRRFLKALGSLGELSVFRSRVCKMDDNMQRDLVQSLRNLEKLQQLDFWCEYRIDADASIWGEEGFVLPQKFRILHLRGFKFCRLPSCISAARLPYLAHLSLLVDSLTEKDLEFLGSLPELRYLFLFTKSTVTISNISASDTYFKKLRFCLMPHSSVSIQCQCKEEDNSSVSFHIWNGTDAMPFGTCIDNCSIRKCRRILYPYAVMPNLEVLHTRVYVRALKDGKFNCANMGLQYLNSLQKVEVRIRCEGASATEVGEVEAELRKATKGHPNRPMLEVYRWNEDKIIPTVQDQKKDKVSVEEEGQNQLEGNPMPDEGNKLKHG
ncbi:hypothetical protein PR202_ga22215 [Eleusine coracana subsp. coracana]|uniref:AAA+ ATPase domain-containing protein n=1 Tax=Eleusine coracana subsp. coracana TaxID=191504 RepID=A0AAV5D2Z7_ELECO|nr:hypothetical protein PR202_ga22215 [Eleusine coracana subsp. coracana]